MPTFMRGAKPSPNHILAAASPYRVLAAPVPQFGVAPSKLDPWGNAQYGDCVSAEEAAAKAWWSVYCGLDETFATGAEVVAFARKWGWLNGAYLTEVMDKMISAGKSIGGKAYTDGHYNSVDYSNELVLQASLDPTDGTGGPTKIAIDADALPPGAGNQMGWVATSGKQFSNTDHCVSVFGYGRADYLYDLLKVTRPSALSSSTPGYLLYTWATIGFVSHDWLMGTCTEAWVRNPTTPGQSPVTPPTPPVPPIPPVPPDPPTPPTPGPDPIMNLPTAGGISFQTNTPWTKSGAKYVASGVMSMSVTKTTQVPVPQELKGIAGIPTIILLLLQLVVGFLPAQYQPAIKLILADLAAGKNWGQIAQDLVALILGKTAADHPIRGAIK